MDEECGQSESVQSTVKSYSETTCISIRQSTATVCQIIYFDGFTSKVVDFATTKKGIVLYFEKGAPSQLVSSRKDDLICFHILHFGKEICLDNSS